MEIVLTIVVVTLGVLLLFWTANTILAKLFPKSFEVSSLISRSFEASSVNSMHAQEEFARNAKRLSIEARVMADAGYKLDATKRHKEDAGLGLIESREVIEAYVRSRDQYARILKAKRP